MGNAHDAFNLTTVSAALTACRLLLKWRTAVLTGQALRFANGYPIDVTDLEEAARLAGIALGATGPVHAAHEAIARIDAMIAKDERETQQRAEKMNPASGVSEWRKHYDNTHGLRRHRARMVEAIAQVSPIPAQQPEPDVLEQSAQTLAGLNGALEYLRAKVQEPPIPAQSRAAESPVVQSARTIVDDGGEPFGRS